jgi:hypothetical protein
LILMDYYCFLKFISNANHSFFLGIMKAKG